MKVLYNILAYSVIVSFLFPLLKIGSTTSVKPDWVFMLFVNVLIFINMNNYLKRQLYAKFYVLLVLIAASTIISNYISGYYFMPQGGIFRLPLTILLMVNKIGVFCFFAYLIQKGYIDISNVLRVISFVFLCALSFGVLQFFDVLSARDITLKYFLVPEGVQEHVFLSANRIVGTAPAVISWGGCSLLICYYFIFLEKSRLLKSIGIILSIINVIGTASRASLFALIISILLVFLIKSIIIKKSFFSLLKVLFSYFLFLGISYFLLLHTLPEQVEFLERRIEHTEEHLTTSGRGEQLNHFMRVMSNAPISSLFGVGDSVIVDYGYLEIDYVYIFVAFGVLGFILHYCLLFYMLKEAYLLRQYGANYFLFCVASTVGYLVFSFGFYFFYELYMGLAYWWLNGIIIGQLYKKREQSNLILTN